MMRASFCRRVGKGLAILVALPLAALSPVARADELEKVEPTNSQSGLPGKVSPAGTGAGAIGSAITQTDSPLPQRLLGGEVTVEEAWKRGQLSIEKATRLLRDEVGFAGNFLVNGPNRSGVIQPEPVRRALAVLLLQHDARLAKVVALGSSEYSQVEKQQKQTLHAVPLRVRMWVGEYLAAQNDARAEVILQGILDEAKPPLNGEQQIELMVTGELLSTVYTRSDNEAASAAMWLKLDPLMDEVVRKVALRIEAARAYTKIGNSQKAQELYMQATKLGGVGYASGLVLFDQARMLMAQGKHEEARKLLKQPEYAANDYQARIVTSALLGQSYYQTGELEKARIYAQETIGLYQSVENSALNLGIEAQVNNARLILRWVSRWTQEPLIASSRRLSIKLSAYEGKVVTRRFFVRSARNVPLDAMTDNPLVKVTVTKDLTEVADPSVSLGHFYVEKEVIVEIAREQVQNGLSANILVTSPQVANIQLKVPVQIGKQS